MAQVWLTRNLDCRVGAQSGEVLLCNLAYGTRVLAQQDSFAQLEAFQQPREGPSEGWLERALGAHLLVSSPPTEVPDFVLRLRLALEKFLGEPAGGGERERLLGLLERAEARFRAHCMPRPYTGDPRHGGHLMMRPERLVDFAFDHTRAFLRDDLEGDGVGLDLALVREFSHRPAMKLRYEQQYCTPYTSQRRAQVMLEALPEGGRVLVLGDDDLVSLALIRRHPDLHVDVLELDADLVAFLKQQGGERLTVLEHDLRQGVPESMREAYDLVTTDPPYASEGMRFFLECVRPSLVPGAASRLFLTTFPGLIESPEELWQDLSRLGLRVVLQRDHFSRYVYNNSYRVEHLTAMRQLGCPLHPTAELLGFPYLYAHFFECAI